MMNAPQYWTLVIGASGLFVASFVLPILYFIYMGMPESGILAIAIMVGLFSGPQLISIWAMLRAKDLKAAENYGEYND